MKNGQIIHNEIPLTQSLTHTSIYSSEQNYIWKLQNHFSNFGSDLQCTNNDKQ